MNEYLLNEITVLNNELVNTQRMLVKQNIEITRLNHQLQLTNADLIQFTYIVSHDLKEPLRMVNSFMELLKNKHGHTIGEKGQMYINLALDGGKRMQKMIDDLLELSRIGRDNSVKELTDLNEVVKIVKENILKLIEETKAEIILGTTLPVIPVYRSDMIRLIQNLLSNAIKFRKKDTIPVIYIAAKEEKDIWVFSIEDNGIGIDKEYFEKIFDIFTRLHTKESYEGSGIGLAICKKLVQYHGGNIWIESTKGKGTTFYFTIQKQ
ncbi:MAG: GHKL domain-containing protein [Ferruginibacter sp.]|nr:GHKL domain-containing protein [Ferruginibacter sp.]